MREDRKEWPMSQSEHGNHRAALSLPPSLSLNMHTTYLLYVAPVSLTGTTRSLPSPSLARAVSPVSPGANSVMD